MERLRCLVDRDRGDARRPRGRCGRLPLLALGAGLAAILALPLATAAQTSQRWSNAGWDEDVGFAAINAMLSGVVTGLFRKYSEEGSFGEGFRTGAAGGVVTYVGKRLAAQRFPAAGLVGRQVASVGGSLVSNARDGRGAFDRLTLQLGLGRLYWDRVESRAVFRPDVVTLYYTTAAVASPRVGFDWSRSLSAGAPVFVTRSGATTLDDNAAGRTFGGVIVMDVNADLPLSHVAAHEHTHVIQYDQQFALWGEAVERGLVSMLGTGFAGVLGRADLGIGLVPFAPFIGRVPRGANPFEIEAELLTARGGS